MFRLEAFTTTSLRTPQGFTHHCINVHTTLPKTEGTKQEPLFTDHDSISASWALPETSGFSQTQTGAVITTYHGNYAFRAAASLFQPTFRTVLPAPPGWGMLSSEPADRTQGRIDSRQDTTAASGSVLCTDEFIFGRQRWSVLHIITQQRLIVWAGKFRCRTNNWV